VNKRLQARRVDKKLDRVYSVSSDVSPALRPKDQEVLDRLQVPPCSSGVYTERTDTYGEVREQKRKHDDPADVARRTRRYEAEALLVCALYPEGTVRKFDASRSPRELLLEITQWLDSF
jgi:adenylate kinase family enzyme